MVQSLLILFLLGQFKSMLTTEQLGRLIVLMRDTYFYSNKGFVGHTRNLVEDNEDIFQALSDEFVKRTS